MSAPSITASASGRVTRPWPTKDEIDQRGRGARLHQRRDAEARQGGRPAVGARCGPARCAGWRRTPAGCRFERDGFPRPAARWPPADSTNASLSRTNYTPWCGAASRVAHALRHWRVATASRRRTRSSSSRIRQAAPIVIALSATLKAGKYQPRQMHLQEVDHVAVHQPVDHVADRAAEDAGQREREQLLPGVRPQHPDDEDRRGDADGGEEPALPARGRRPGRRTPRRCCGPARR